MSYFETLALLESTPGKKDKIKILKANKSLELEEIFDAVFNYKRRYFMRKFEINATSSEIVDDLHNEFLSLLKRLENRVVTGNTAQAEVETFFRKCSEEQAKWYKRTLRQDLKIGVSSKTLVKCGYNIPVFELQLAKDGRSCKRLNQLLKNNCKASRKYDGYRTLAMIEEGVVTLYTRNGIIYKNFPGIEEGLESLFPNETIIFDGEITSLDFNAMQKTAFSTKSKNSVGDMVYNIFDVLTLEEWESDNFKIKHQDRQERLKLLFEKVFKEDARFNLIKQIPVTSLEQILELEKEFILEGYEGVMVIPNIPYYRDRKANRMLKFKTFESMDCVITGFYEGIEDTKNEGRLGGLYVMQENNITCEVGGGFTEEERIWIWENKDKVLGTVIEVKYQEIGSNGKMRFPSKHSYRFDLD